MKKSFTVTRASARTALAFLMALAAASAAHVIVSAQGGAGQNINVVTGTGTFTNDLDLYRKNEPVIGISSVNPAHMLVAYNDARTVDSGDDFGTGSQAAGPGLFAKVLDFFRLPWLRDRDRKGGWEAEGPAAANQAWIGLSFTDNGGKNWYSGLHPGRYVAIPPPNPDPFDPYPWSSHDESQLDLYEAANDPVLATTPDRFFLAGIAFNLPTQSAAGQGVGFISRFTDRNAQEKGQNIHFDGTKVLLKSTDFATPSGTNFFVDKPSVWAGANGHVYVAFVVFDQNDPNKLSSTIRLFRSADYGNTWSPPKGLVISQPLTRNQSPWIVGDNTNENTVYIGWRVFSNPLYPTLTNAVVGRKSIDGGMNFTPSVPYGVALLLRAFDQPQGNLSGPYPTVPSVRSAAYPTAAMDGNGALHVAVQEYVYPANYLLNPSLRGRPLAPNLPVTVGVPRVTVTTSLNQGITWSQRKAADLANGAGTQFMPVMTAVGEPGPTCTGQTGQTGPRSRVALMYYDARPNGVGVNPGGTGFVQGGDKQFDVRIAQASACTANASTGLSFTSFEQVSQYKRSPTPAPNITPPSYPIQPIPVQPAGTPQYAAVNRGYTMSCKGNCAFSGDYIHAIPRVPYVKTANGWKSTTAVMGEEDRNKLPAAVVQGVWTDTRDALLPMVGAPRQVPLGASLTIDALPWDMYDVADPTRFALCTNLGTRHQSVYTMEYTPGRLFASAPVTFRASTIPRGYPLHVENRGPSKIFLKLTIDPLLSLGSASFDYTDFDPNVLQDPVKSTGFGQPYAVQTAIVVDSISSVTGTVVVGPNVSTPILITVEETDSNGVVISPPTGAKTTVTLHTTGADASSTETSVPAIDPVPVVTKPYAGLIPSGGLKVKTSEPEKTLGSPTPFSPNPFSPNPFSPNPFSPNPFSPNPFSPNPFSPNVPPDVTVYDVTDISYVVTNDGEQTAAFNAVVADVQNALGDHVFEVLINRAVPASIVNYDSLTKQNCRAVDSAQAVPISTIAVPFSPNPFSPNPFSPNPFSPNYGPNPFSPNPFSPNYPPVFSNSTFYVAPKGSTSGALARLEAPGMERGSQRLARREPDGRIRNASLTPTTPGAYIAEPVNDVMVVTVRDLLLSKPCANSPTFGCGTPVTAQNLTFTVKGEIPNVVDCTGQQGCPGNGRRYDPIGPPVTGTQIAHHLAFTAQPTNTSSGGTIAPPIKVEIRDAFDKTVTNSLQQRQVTLGIAPLSCPGGTLSGVTATSDAGIAIFGHVVITTSSQGCTDAKLVASSGTLKQATSDRFDVVSLALVNTQLLDAIVGSPYPPAPQSFQVLGGQPPFTFARDPNAKVNEGAATVEAKFPPGVDLSSTGVFFGTPTIVGNYAFRIIVTDANGHTTAANFCIHVDPNQTAAVVTTDLSQGNAASLAATLLDPLDAGVAVTNATFKGSNLALGTFTGGGSAIAGVGFHQGVVLSSGNIADVKGPNNTTSVSTNFGLSGDADLEGLLGVSNTTHDGAVLEFDFMPTCQDAASCNVTFEYVFGSDEYHEYANSAYNDVFGFFLTDVTAGGVKKNYALLPNIVPETPVSINTVNGGNPLGSNAKHPEFFRSNRTANNLSGPLNLQADGLTVPLQFNAPVISSNLYHIKIAIADVADGIYDSMVFIKSGSFKVTHICPIIVP